MTKEQWYELAVEDWVKFDKAISFPSEPLQWLKEKSILLAHIEYMDQLTEVYNLENKGE